MKSVLPYLLLEGNYNTNLMFRKPCEVTIPITILHPASLTEISPKVDYLAPPEIEEVAPTVSSINFVEQTLGRSPSPQRQSSPVVATEPPFPFTEKFQVQQDDVFVSTTTLTGANSQVSIDLPDSQRHPTDVRSSTLNSRKLAPLKSFVGASRSSTARRPPLKGPSPASLLSKSITANATNLEGLESIYSKNLNAFKQEEFLPEGMERIDLAVEMDKLLITQME